MLQMIPFIIYTELLVKFPLPLFVCFLVMMRLMNRKNSEGQVEIGTLEWRRRWNMSGILSSIFQGSKSGKNGSDFESS